MENYQQKYIDFLIETCHKKESEKNKLETEINILQNEIKKEKEKYFQK